MATGPLRRIANRVRTLRMRVRREWFPERLGARDVDARLVPEARGEPASPRYFRDLFDRYLAATIHGYRDPAAVPPADDDRRERPPYRFAGHPPFGVDPAAVDWHREPVFGVRWPRRYVGALSDYRPGSDLVLFWHFNKAWFLLDVSARYAQTREPAYAHRWFDVVDSWIRQNPYLVGMNWRSPMEVGTRLAMWGIGLSEIGAGPWAGEARLGRLFESMIRQAEYVSENFSFREISNNHLISDAAFLYVFAGFAPILAAAPAWRSRSEEVLEAEARRQVLRDGFQFENSVCYHLYVLEFYLMYLLTKAARGETPPPAVLDAVERLGRASTRLLSPAGRWPRFGDDSMPEYFVLRSYGELAERPPGDPVRLRDVVREAYARPLGRVAWGRGLLDVSSPLRSAHHFDEAGYTVVRAPGAQLVAAAGPEHGGEINDGHLHSEGASFELEVDGRPVVIDSGTYLYFFDLGIRRHFKEWSAHNTVAVDGREPMCFGETFRWRRRVGGATVGRRLDAGLGAVVVERFLPADGGASFRHRRGFVWIDGEAWIVVDALSPAGDAPAAAPPRAGGTGAGGDAAGNDRDGRHEMEALFHTPFAPDAVTLEGATGPGGEGAVSGAAGGAGGAAAVLPGGVVVEAAGAWADGVPAAVRLERLVDPDDRRTWYSPWYGRLERGTTLRATVPFAARVVAVYVLRRGDAATAGVRFTPGGAAGVEIELPVGGAGRRVRVTVDPPGLVVDGEPVPLDAPDRRHPAG